MKTIKMECATVKILMKLGFENMLQEAINSKYSIYVMTNLSDYPPFNKLGLVDMNFAIYDKKESNFYGSIANYPSLSELLGMEIIQGGEYVSTLDELQANLFWELTVIRKIKNA